MTLLKHWLKNNADCDRIIATEYYVAAVGGHSAKM